MNLSIVYPNGTEVSVNEFDKSMVIDELYEYWEGGYDITDITTELPKSIIDLSRFDAVLVKEAKITGITVNQVEEDHVKEALEQCISDEWDVLNELINDQGEDYAAACLEYANGGSLEDAEQAHIGYYKFAKDYCEEVFECPDNILPYIDWDAVWADYCHDVVEINGYYFNS